MLRKNWFFLFFPSPCASGNPAGKSNPDFFKLIYFHKGWIFGFFFFYISEMETEGLELSLSFPNSQYCPDQPHSLYSAHSTAMGSPLWEEIQGV